jgi:translation initiation factor IF-3
MNYGKYKFEAQKKEKEAKKKQKAVDIKTMELSMRIEEHDMLFKAKQVRKFLQSGAKVKVLIKGVRGRLAGFAHQGIENMNKFFEMVQEDAIIDQKPTLAGTIITMMLAPKNAK